MTDASDVSDATEPRAGAGYERTDAHVRPVVAFGVTLVVVVAVALAVGFWLERRVVDELRAEHPPSALEELRRAPDAPGLQAVPAEELRELRAWEERTLGSTEWVDPLNGVVRIPIERALELVLEEGLPARAEERR